MRRGFSFIELLFAVMILGAGFIMLAALFPVAAGQARSSLDETTAAALARSAASTLAGTLRSADFPAGSDSAAVQRFDEIPAAWQRAKGDLILASDPRFACVPMVRRVDEGTAQLILVIARCDNRASYDPRLDVASDPNAVNDAPCTLQPRHFRVSIDRGGGGRADLIRFQNDGSGAIGAVAEGTFVIITQDPTGSGGQIYRVGNPVDAASGLWELAPDGGLSAGQPPVSNAFALVLGRGYADPTHPSAGFAGRAQDVAIYTTFVALR